MSSILVRTSSIIALVLLATALSIHAQPKNGFIIEHGLIPPDQILRGGPARDGIPSIDKPVFEKIKNARNLRKDERILGIKHGGITKAYPISIMNWHEVVNDSIGDLAYTITYCPLCGSGVAFDRLIAGETLSFGVSGLLYNSDVLLYDRESESLWSQLMGQAITGKYKGAELATLPLTHTTLSLWRQENPGSLILSEHTGYSRDYERNPYEGYEKNRDIYFPVSHKKPSRYHPK